MEGQAHLPIYWPALKTVSVWGHAYVNQLDCGDKFTVNTYIKTLNHTS